MPAYKKNGFHYSKHDYQNQTYNITDIFDNTTLEQLGNKSNLLYTETKSLFYGRGYTVCFNNKMATKNVTFIFLKNNFDFQVYIHSKGEELLFGLSICPVEVCHVS